MAQKNLMAQVAWFLKRTTTGELPAPELALLSEEDLQRVVGGERWSSEEADRARQEEADRARQEEAERARKEEAERLRLLEIEIKLL